MRALVVALVAAVASAPLVAADVSASAECGSDGDRIVIDDGGGGLARASCSQSSFGWVLWAGAGTGAAGFTWAWLAWLRWVPALGLFTRLRQDRLLDHPVRAQIMQLVASEPGIHYQAIVERTGRAMGGVSHHVSVLVRGGLLSSVRAPGHRSFFVKGSIDAPVMRGLAAVKSATAAALLRAVAQRPEANKRSLARELGCRESAVRYHVRRFQAAGLMDDHDGVRLSPAGHHVLTLLPEPVAAPTRPPGLTA